MTGWGSAIAFVALMAVSADEPTILWARSWEAAYEEARLRNVPIFVAFLKDGCPGSMAMQGDAFRDRMLVSFLNEVAVPLIAHTADVGISHEPEEYVDPKTGKRSFRCPLYKTITCTEHNAIHGKALDVISVKVKRTPKVFVLGPDGKPLERKGEVKSTQAREIVGALMRAQKRLGKPLSRSSYRKASEKIEAGRAAFEAKDYPKAISTLRAVGRNRKAPEGLRKKAEAILEELNGRGLELLREAKRVIEEDPEEGLKRLRKLRSDFRGLPVADEAKRALIEAKKKSSAEDLDE